MSKVSMIEIIEELVTNYSIEITAIGDNKTLLFDMQTKAKSHLHIDKEGFCRMRYGKTHQLDMNQDMQEVLHDIAYLVDSCIHDRSFIDYHWYNFVMEFKGRVSIGCL